MLQNEGPTGPNNQSNPNSEASFQSREDYVKKLKHWLDEARLWAGLCTEFPYYANIQTQTEDVSRFYHFNPVQPTRPGPVEDNWNNVPVFQQGAYEFVIPPLWKRIAAEFLDFLILLFIKMLLTFIVIEMFYVVSIDNYRLESFKKNLQDPKIAMQMSVEILTLEILHRFIVCCYEIYWLRGGMCATPGKKYMGLVVINVDDVIAVPGSGDDVVTVVGCRPLGLQKAIVRTVLKNIFLGVMLPMCFYIIRFNRTGYDAASNSLVVELNQHHHQAAQ